MTTPPRNPRYQSGNEVMHCPDHTELVTKMGELIGRFDSSIITDKDTKDTLDRVFAKLELIATAVQDVKQKQAVWDAKVMGVAAGASFVFTMAAKYILGG